MIKVEDINSFPLYQRSLNLSSELYKFVKENENSITMAEGKELRSLAVSIPKKIASAVGQLNIKVLFKELNEAKQLVRIIEPKMIEVMDQYDIDTWENSIIANYHTQVLKLMNAYFAKVSNKKR